MCGITGILNLNSPIDAAELDRFTDALSHRGPDGRGTFIDGNFGLGHRRLAILDLSESGKCPMPYGGSDGKRYWITYNGEVYNFLELRKELEKLGHRFHTQTDTEVVVAAYSQWNEDCLPKFNGMWAFAIWDTVEKTLFLARDRYAVKPLYYMMSNRFVFASEIKAFLALDGFSPEIDNDVIATKILKNSYSYEGITDNTIMQGVRRLCGGYYLTINNRGEIICKKWWETAANIPRVPVKYEDQIEQFRELFVDAVRIRMRSDVPVGTCLSGGVDSSSVASSMAWLHNKKTGLERCPKDWQRTFIATFPDSKIDEREYADAIVRHIGAKPHYWKFDDHEALKHVIDSVWATEDVYGGLNVPIWGTYRELRNNNVIVSLDGHGGDELLAGYTWYLDWPIGRVNQNLYSDFHTTLLPAILRNYDRCSMAHGIEVRMPFMDWRLVTFTFGLQAEAKIGGGQTKRILRDAMSGILPEQIRLRRSKIGFNSPMIEWYNGGMIHLMEKIMNHKLWLESPFWNGHELRNYALTKTKARAWKYDDWGTSLHIWTLMNIVIWQMLFVEQNFSTIEN